MRILFMGTPDFAVPALKKLAREGYDITLLDIPADGVIRPEQVAEAIREDTARHMMTVEIREQTEPQKIINVNGVLNELIEQSVQLVGKPVALMNKDDKVKAIRFLNDSGAFLVTKSTDKVAKYFGISKYTLYSYIDANKQQEENKK